MQSTTGSSVVTSCKQPKYAPIKIPSKPPTEYDHIERRAVLLQQIRDLGHPSMIHQGEAAERYGVSQQQISKDYDRWVTERTDLEEIQEHLEFLKDAHQEQQT